jgi:hypothetical protein
MVEYLNAYTKFQEQNINAQDLSIWLLDMQQLETGVMILAAAANLQDSPQIRYAAGNIINL